MGGIMKILATSSKCQPNLPRAPKASRRPRPAQPKLLKDKYLGGLGVLGAHFGQTGKISGEQPNPPNRRRTRRLEQQLQKAICEHLTVRARHEVYWWHHPAGGYRSPAEAAIFKSIGAKPGLPDILLVYQGRLYGLELKAEGGSLSPTQRTAHVMLRKAARSLKPPQASTRRAACLRTGTY